MPVFPSIAGETAKYFSFLRHDGFIDVPVERIIIPDNGLFLNRSRIMGSRDGTFHGENIDVLPDATFVIDLEGKVIARNRAMEELTGVSAESMSE